MTIQYDNTNNIISTVGSDSNIPINIQPKGTGGLNVLGSGQNLILGSNSFTNVTYWGTNNATVATTVVTTDPFGGSNAYLVTASSAGVAGVQQGGSSSNLSVNYTLSLYAKAGTATWLRLFATSASPYAWFNLSTGVLGTVQSGSTATITSVGNGWYRCTISSVTNNVFGVRIADADGSTVAASGTTLYIYGSQLELGSVANTYIPTTTTAIYGTPTLTLSGVAGLGLQSDGSLYVQPAGTGAIQAQPTTSTTTGGNARGANAVDWQTERNAASQVASGQVSFVGGGTRNTASSYNSTVVGGFQNTVAGVASFVGSGSICSASGNYSFVGGGQVNSATGYMNFIGGGFTNSGTANAAVTTQSGTMNGTTSVTLSGSNANIKVGQLVTGTSIASETYVAAISGTSLTLSKNASGSSTSTLSFFTPHGVVVGGGNNQATGSYSFIGGGGDAGTAGNRNTASGDWSTVAGGFKNVASGFGSFVGGGRTNTASGGGAVVVGGGTYVSGDASNTASGASSFVGSGLSNQASANYAFVGAGIQNSANAQFSAIIGGTNGAVRAIEGNHIFPACYAPIANSSGMSQTALLVLARQTTDATATVLRSNNSAAGTTNQVILPNNSAYYFRGEVISGVTGGGNTKGWFIEGVIKRGANAASTALVGTPTVTSNYADAGASTWTIAVTADTTNGGLAITFTGQAGTTIRTVAQIRTTEMTF